MKVYNMSKFICGIIVCLYMCKKAWTIEEEYYNISGIGDPGMKRDGLRVAIEAWNQCNEVHEEAPNMGSPRQADCFDVLLGLSFPSEADTDTTDAVHLLHHVNEKDNRLGFANQGPFIDKPLNVDEYAAWKEVFLGDKCQVPDFPRPWNFWMIMLKSGNMDTEAAICPNNGYKSVPFPPDPRFPCFGPGCMNMPKIYHDYTVLDQDTRSMQGRFYGTWDLDVDAEAAATRNDTSYYSVIWRKEEVGKGGWIFHHVLKTSTKYPWLMLYLRSDATTGLSGGYHYETRGMSKIIPKSPHFKVTFKLNIIQGGGSNSQFYLMDIGSCWKNNGESCNGDVTSDVTRYSEMVINPETPSWCKPDALYQCPPYHTFPNGTRVHRNDTEHFPYDAYHVYCAPGNAEFVEKPYHACDPYSNPQSQEILQIVPHPVWGEYGYPTTKGEGWIGDSRTWLLDVGRLSQSLYFYQDPGTKPVERQWPSVDLGTEVYMMGNQRAEWEVSDFDIIIPKEYAY